MWCAVCAVSSAWTAGPARTLVRISQQIGFGVIPCAAGGDYLLLPGAVLPAARYYLLRVQDYLALNMITPHACTFALYCHLR